MRASMVGRVGFLLLSVGVLVAGWTEPDPFEIRFVPITEEAGIRFRHVDGRSGRRYFLETVGSGAGLFDYDNDGNLDLYLVNGADLPGSSSPKPPTNRLYRNNGDGTFTDVTEQAGVGDTGYGAGCAVADIDNDGDLDLYVTNYGPNVLYRNNGDGTFTDITERAGVGDPRWSLSATFVDVDADGFVDLYVTNYIDFSFEDHRNCTIDGVPVYCAPETYPSAPDTFYRNNGDGTFSDVSDEYGVRELLGKGMGVVATDFDQDGWIDLYVGNDVGVNFLLRNVEGRRFEEVGWMAGVDADENGLMQGTMGVDAGDIDRDGRLDLVALNFQRQPNALYRNEGDGFFAEVTFPAGLGYSLPYVGWGTDFCDIDNDGDQDLVVVNGHLQDLVEQFDTTTTYAQANQLLLNDGSGRFVDVSEQAGPGFQIVKSSRGLAVGDIDNDGDLDLVITNSAAAPDLLRNDTGLSHHWISIQTVGTQSNRAGIGARLELHVGKLILVDEVRSASGYLSQNDLRVHFGLGTADRIDRLRVRWPNGRVETYRNLPVDQFLVLREGEGSPEEAP